MQNQNFDGIKKPKDGKNSLSSLPVKTVARLSVDGLVRRKKTNISIAVKREFRPIFITPALETKLLQEARSFSYIFYQRLPIFATTFLLFLAFVGGMWAALNTKKSAADDPATIAPISVSSSTIDTTVTNDVLFNTPLEMLKNYFQSKMEADILAQRKIKLAAFLEDRNSPLAGEAQTIAEQDHWKFILAISFAESTLGKKCYYNNCSGIGGAQIKSYQSLKHWILDFNHLLDKRYKDQTLEQMCGVYVKPCSTNWLLATGQILDALKEQNIE